MIATLAKDNAQWIMMARSICGNTDLANDLVQDMYLKLFDCEKEISAGYVYLTIKSIWLNGIKKEKQNTFCDLPDNIQSEETNLEFESERHIEFKTVKAVFDSLKMHERLIIEHSYKDGRRKFARDSGISDSTVKKIRKELNIKVWASLQQKKSKEQETLLPQLQIQLGLPPANLATSAGMF